MHDMRSPRLTPSVWTPRRFLLLPEARPDANGGRPSIRRYQLTSVGPRAAVPPAVQPATVPSGRGPGAGGRI